MTKACGRPRPGGVLGVVTVRKLRQLIRVAAGLTGLAILLIGLPVVLIRYVGWPLPQRIPSEAQLYAWLEDPVTLDLLIKGAAVVVWLLWAALSAAVAVEAVAVARGVRLPRLRFTTPVHGVAAGLVGAVALTSTSAAVPAATPLLPVPTPAPSTGDTSTFPPPATNSTDARITNTNTTATATPPTTQVTVVVDGQRYSYTVTRGDNLSKIARQWLGDPDRWPGPVARDLRPEPRPTLARRWDPHRPRCDLPRMGSRPTR